MEAIKAAMAEHKTNRAAHDASFQKSRDSQEKVRQLILKWPNVEERNAMMAEMKATDIDPVNSKQGIYKLWSKEIYAASVSKKKFKKKEKIIFIKI